MTHIHLYKNQWPYNYAVLTRHLFFVFEDEIIISIYFWSLFKSSVWGHWCINTNTKKNFPTWSRQVAQIEGKPFRNLFWQLNILKVIKQTRIVWPNYEHTQHMPFEKEEDTKSSFQSWTLLSNMTNQDRIRNAVLPTALSTIPSNCTDWQIHGERTDAFRQMHISICTTIPHQPLPALTVPPPRKKTALL